MSAKSAVPLRLTVEPNHPSSPTVSAFRVFAESTCKCSSGELRDSRSICLSPARGHTIPNTVPKRTRANWNTQRCLPSNLNCNWKNDVRLVQRRKTNKASSNQSRWLLCRPSSSIGSIEEYDILVLSETCSSFTLSFQIRQVSGSFGCEGHFATIGSRSVGLSHNVRPSCLTD